MLNSSEGGKGKQLTGRKGAGDLQRIRYEMMSMRQVHESGKEWLIELSCISVCRLTRQIISVPAWATNKGMLRCIRRCYFWAAGTESSYQIPSNCKKRCVCVWKGKVSSVLCAKYTFVLVSFNVIRVEYVREQVARHAIIGCIKGKGSIESATFTSSTVT